MSTPTVIGNLQLETFRDSVATAEGSKVKRKHADLSMSCITIFLLLFFRGFCTSRSIPFARQKNSTLALQH